ncbi:hypothetical protein B0J12DRAFT_769518 [Macrophomina phaseolina]|uniref:Uncharacterized protein n=1 Tax=Macrophomina phaseolina TaxID=35725 RepID=A0ABQ8GPE5_9PEZI|nr:hypothetical protein B0J12DRAFT_769518 [Macrophomina phaseolina]
MFCERVVWADSAASATPLPTVSCPHPVISLSSLCPGRVAVCLVETVCPAAKRRTHQPPAGHSGWFLRKGSKWNRTARAELDAAPSPDGERQTPRWQAVGSNHQSTHCLPPATHVRGRHSPVSAVTDKYRAGLCPNSRQFVVVQLHPGNRLGASVAIRPHSDPPSHPFFGILATLTVSQASNLPAIESCQTPARPAAPNHLVTGAAAGGSAFPAHLE